MADNYATITAICILSVFAHEGAHFIAAKAFNVRVKKVGVRWCGPYIVRDRTTGFPEVAICLAGIIANLALAGFLTGFPHRFNLAMVAVNLLLPKSDGWNALAALKSGPRLIRCTR